MKDIGRKAEDLDCATVRGPVRPENLAALGSSAGPLHVVFNRVSFARCPEVTLPPPRRLVGVTFARCTGPSQRVAGWLSGGSLRSFYTDRTGWSALEGMKARCRATIRDLQVEKFTLEERQLQTIASLANLRSLFIHECVLPANGLAILSPLDRLAKLWVTNCEISGGGSMGLAELAAMPSLEFFDYAGTAVSEAGLEGLKFGPHPIEIWG